MVEKNNRLPGNRFQPDYSVPPGVTLLETIESLGMTQTELAERTGRPKKTINEIIKGKAAITPETALQLELVLGTSASFWNNLELNYRDSLARAQAKERLEAHAAWLKQIPVNHMVKFNWIEKCPTMNEQLEEVLKFFGVASPEAWDDIWGNLNVAFRQSTAFESSPGAIATWLRMGEIIARKITCKPYKESKFIRALEKIRLLTKESHEVFLPETERLCAEAGVAFVLIPEMPHCRVSGATHWLNRQKAIIQLSFRYKSDDHLWFTFFHEAGHIIHHSKDQVFLEGNGTTSDLEEQANLFAADFLIPPEELGSFLRQSVTAHRVRRFAQRLGIAPGIVVGRLQHDGLIRYNQLANLKRRYEWVIQ